MTNEDSISYRVFSAMVDNVEALSLVRECRELEERYKSDFASEILSANEPADRLEIIRNAQKFINKKDKCCKASKYQFIHKITECVGWKKLWDQALDHGPSVNKAMKNFVRVISYPDHSPSKCPLCSATTLDEPSLAKHVINNHTSSDNSWCTLLNSLTAMDPSFFNHVLCLLHVF